MPAISNWWGALVLPLLTWFLVGWIEKHEQSIFSKSVLAGLIGSAVYGAFLTLAFYNGLNQLASLMGPGLLILALFIPIYRAEYVLGFILSLTVGFGAILPTIFTVVIAPLAYLLYRYIRPIPRALVSLVSK